MLAPFSPSHGAMREAKQGHSTEVTARLLVRFELRTARSLLAALAVAMSCLEALLYSPQRS